MTPETNPVTSSALKWPLVDMARTVCHFGLRCGVLCACGQYLYASECKVGCGVCLSGKRGVACGIENTAGLLWLWSLMLESHCLHDTTGVPICPQSRLLWIVLWLLCATFRYDDVIFKTTVNILQTWRKTLLMESFVAHKTFLELHNKTSVACSWGLFSKHKENDNLKTLKWLVWCNPNLQKPQNNFIGCYLQTLKREL